MSRFEYWKSDKNGKWYFHLKAANGEIICSSQGYTTSQNCVKGIDAVMLQAPVASIEQLEQTPAWNYFEEIKAMLAEN